VKDDVVSCDSVWFKQLVTMAATGAAFVRLSQSIAGALSLSRTPLFVPCTTSICRPNPNRRIHSAFASLDYRPVLPSSEHHRLPSRRVHTPRRKIACVEDDGGSAFYPMSTAAEAYDAERSLYSGRHCRFPTFDSSYVKAWFGDLELSSYGM
jgi:hypothetical protein